MIELRKPRPIRQGDTIAVAAPSSLPVDLSAIDQGVATLIERGYRVVVARPTFQRHGYLSAPDDVRADELNGFLRRPDVAAIIAVRGGYGALRILDTIDYEAAARDPKLVIGYSDITALQLALLARTGDPSLSGPMIATEWGAPDQSSEALFWDLATGGVPDPLLGPQDEVLEPVRPGRAEGPLVGGNLTMISKLIGTPFLPDLGGAILFLEEVGEEPYRIDGLFAHLRLSGAFDRIAGLVLGGFTEWEPEHDRPVLPLDAVIDHYVAKLNIPVARGLRYGHFPVKNTLPIGIRARLQVSDGRAELGLLEAVVT
ncbi:MAG: S66 peptidase family protein [Bacteroidota bacterium]